MTKRSAVKTIKKKLADFLTDEQVTSAEQIKQKSTLTIKSPTSGNVYVIRMMHAMDGVGFDFIPKADPTLSEVLQREQIKREITESSQIQAKIQKGVVSRCVLNPTIVYDKTIKETTENEVHVELLGPDIEWLYEQIDEFTKGEATNPFTVSADSQTT